MSMVESCQGTEHDVIQMWYNIEKKRYRTHTQGTHSSLGVRTIHNRVFGGKACFRFMGSPRKGPWRQGPWCCRERRTGGRG